MSQLTFNAVFEDAGDGWVYAHVPELPEVHTQGKDLDEARAMVRDAIELVLEDRRERGEPISDRGWALVEQAEVAARRSATSSGISPLTVALSRARDRDTRSGTEATGQRTAVPRHRETKPATARGICRQLGIPPPSMH